MYGNKEFTLIATVTGEGKLEWKSDDPTTVSVDEGKILALKVGTAKVTATVGEVTATCTVTVSYDESKFALEIAEKEVSIYKGETSQIEATLKYNDKAIDIDATKSYESSNGKVAKLAL